MKGGETEMKVFRCDNCGKETISLWWIYELKLDVCDRCYRKLTKKIKKERRRNTNER